MKITPHQEKFLGTINEQGVEFAGTHRCIGTIVLHPDQIELFTEDPDEFAAQYYNVSKSQLLEWEDFISSWQCVGTTKSGVRCKASAPTGFNISKPEHFQTSNPDCYCPKHKNQANETL